jgi:hypothetical protein
MSNTQDKESEAFNSTASKLTPFSTFNRSSSSWKKASEASPEGKKFQKNKNENFGKIKKNEKYKKFEKTEKSPIQGIFVLKKDLLIQNLLSKKIAKNRKFNKEKFSFTFNKESTNTNSNTIFLQNDFPVLSLVNNENGNVNAVPIKQVKNLNHTLRIENLNKSKFENEKKENKSKISKNLNTCDIFSLSNTNTNFSITNSNFHSTINSNNNHKNYTKIKFPKLTLQAPSLSIYDMKQSGLFNPFNHTTMEKFSRRDLKFKIRNEDRRKVQNVNGSNTEITSEDFNPLKCGKNKNNCNSQLLITGNKTTVNNIDFHSKSTTFVTNLNFQKIEEINNLIYESQNKNNWQYNKFKKQNNFRQNLNLNNSNPENEKNKNKIHPILINNNNSRMNNKLVSPPLSAHTLLNHTRESYAQTQSQFHTITPVQNLKKVTLFSTIKSDYENVSINNLKKNNVSMGNLHISNVMVKRIKSSKSPREQTFSKSSEKHFSKEGNANTGNSGNNGNFVNNSSNYSKIKSKQYMQRNLNDDISLQLSGRNTSNNFH